MKIQQVEEKKVHCKSHFVAEFYGIRLLQEVDNCTDSIIKRQTCGEREQKRIRGPSKSGNHGDTREGLGYNLCYFSQRI